VSTASAADMAVKAPPPPVVVYNWTGFYIGGDVGGAWGRDNVTHSTTFAAPGLAFPVDAAAVTAASSPSFNPSTFVGGVYAGYNYQSGNVVFGVEGDISSFRLRANANGVFPFPSTPALTFTANTSVSTDWLFTLRPRIGYANAGWLFYVTGGLAVTNENVNQTAGILNAATFTSNNSSTQAGWTAGVGIERMIANNWIVRAEYLHTDFGTVTGPGIANLPTGVLGNLLCTSGQTVITGPGTYTGCSVSNRLTAEIVRVGISYKFSGPVVTKY
jgi:outer membrane immunogenic protein